MLQPNRIRYFASFLLAVASFPANAALIEFEVAGTVTTLSGFDFVQVPSFATYTLPTAGDAFVATFTFDTAAALTGTGPGTATYGAALMTATYSLPDSNLSITAATAPVFARNEVLVSGQGTTDFWIADLLDGTSVILDSLYASDIPADPSPEELTFDSASAMAIFLEDFGPSDIYSISPPPLVRPDDSGWVQTDSTFSMGWEADSITGDNPTVSGTIESITVVPEPSKYAIALGVIAFGLVLRRRFSD